MEAAGVGQTIQMPCSHGCKLDSTGSATERGQGAQPRVREAQLLLGLQSTVAAPRIKATLMLALSLVRRIRVATQMTLPAQGACLTGPAWTGMASTLGLARMQMALCRHLLRPPLRHLFTKK